MLHGSEPTRRRLEVEEAVEKPSLQGDRFAHCGDDIVLTQPVTLKKKKTTRKIGREKGRSGYYLSSGIAAFPNGTREHSGY